MTNPFLLVLRDAQHAPVSVCLLVCTLLLHVMDQFGSVHAKSWAYSFSDVVLKKQYYRMLTYSLFHRNAVHLYLTLTSLWSCRQLEIKYGSVFYFNYTVLLLLSDSLMTTCLLRYLAAFGDPDSATAFISALRGRLQTFEMVGFTNVLLCWLSYESVRNTDASSSFYLFGVLPVYWGLAPIVFMLAVPLVCNRTSSFSSLSSIVSGYLLAMGMLRVIPEGDAYWNACVLVDIALYMGVQYARTRNNTLAERDLALPPTGFDDAHSPATASVGGASIGLSNSHSFLDDYYTERADHTVIPVIEFADQSAAAAAEESGEGSPGSGSPGSGSSFLGRLRGSLDALRGARYEPVSTSEAEEMPDLELAPVHRRVGSKEDESKGEL